MLALRTSVHCLASKRYASSFCRTSALFWRLKVMLLVDLVDAGACACAPAKVLEADLSRVVMTGIKGADALALELHIGLRLQRLGVVVLHRALIASGVVGQAG